MQRLEHFCPKKNLKATGTLFSKKTNLKATGTLKVWLRFGGEQVTWSYETRASDWNNRKTRHLSADDHTFFRQTARCVAPAAGCRFLETRATALFRPFFFLPCPSLGQLLKMRYSRELPSARRFVSCKKPSAYLSDFFLTWNDCFDGRKRRRWARASYRHDSGEILCVHRLEGCSRAYRASISKWMEQPAHCLAHLLASQWASDIQIFFRVSRCAVAAGRSVKQVAAAPTGRMHFKCPPVSTVPSLSSTCPPLSSSVLLRQLSCGVDKTSQEIWNSFKIFGLAL